jgi:hypothetical protein
VQQRKLGFVLLAVGAASMVVGFVALVIGFVASSVAPIYVACGLSAMAGLSCLAGTVLLLVSAAK